MQPSHALASFCHTLNRVSILSTQIMQVQHCACPILGRQPPAHISSEGLQFSCANKTLRLHRTQRDRAVLQMRTTFVAHKTIFVSVCLLWFSDQTGCWSQVRRLHNCANLTAEAPA